MSFILENKKPITVIYLAGWGRSGSTVVGSLLGRINGASYVGELWNLWEDAFIENEFCGCVRRYDDCGFWKGVFDSIPITRELGQSLFRFKLKRLGSRALIFRRKKHFFNDSEMSNYADTFKRLISTVSEKSGSNIIIDASKTPNMIPVYGQIPGVRLCVIHLVRDPRAVAYSWFHRSKKRGPDEDSGNMHRHNPAKSTLSWLARNYFISKFGSTLNSDYQVLRYEDFVASNGSALETVVNKLKLPELDLSHNPIGAGVTFSHSVRGNPIRFESSEIKIKEDDTWKEKLPIIEKLLVSILASPLLKKYRYKIRL